MTLCLVPSGSFATQTDKKGAGDVTASFLEVSPSVRMAALGGDQAAAKGGVEALYSNPAGMSSLQLPELWLSHQQSFLDSQYSTLALGLPFKNQTVGFSGQYINEGSEERVGVDASNAPIRNLGTFRYSTTWLQAVWAKNITAAWALGLALKGWQEKRYSSSSNGWAGDIGIQRRGLIKNLDIGISGKNLGPRVDGFDLPSSAAIGAAYRLLDHATIFSEYDMASHRESGIRAGIEYDNRRVSLRAGYNSFTSDLDDPLAHFAFGGGVRIQGWKIDYTWTPLGDLGDQHRIGLSFGFGMTPEEREAAARDLDIAMSKRMKDHAASSFSSANESMKNGRWEEAKENYSQALQWDPNFTEARSKLALANDKIKFSKAEELYRSGSQQAEQGQWMDAALQCQQALKLVPSHREAAALLAQAKKKIRNAPAAQKSAEDEIIDRGIGFYVDGNYEAALREWKKVPSGSKARVNEYTLRAEKMILASELKNMKATQRKENSEVTTLNQQAYTFYMLNQTEKAVEVWKKVLALDPSNKDARTALKEAEAKQQLVSAEQKSNPVYELNAEAIQAYNRDELEKAVLIWRRALVLDPGNIWIQNNIKRVESELAARKLSRVP